jgi:hypothetical protein
MEPRVERQRSVAQIIEEPSIGFDEDLLDDIRGVEAGGESRMEPVIDHTAESTTESCKQRGTGLAVAICSELDERFGPDVVRVPRHHAGLLK